MFESDARTATGHYQVELVPGQYRQKKHQEEVQRVLDEGSARKWRLVSATATGPDARAAVDAVGSVLDDGWPGDDAA